MRPKARFRALVLGTLSAGLLASGALVAVGLAGGNTAKLPDLYPLLPEIHSNKNSRWVDTFEAEGKVLYRFDTVIMNRSGAGALDVYRTSEGSGITQVLWKNATHAPPGAVTKDTPLPTAGGDVELRQISGQQIEYSDLAGHHHFHAPLVAKYSLLNLDGNLVSEAAKNSAGFCLYDSWGSGNFSNGTLCRPGETKHKGAVRMGISPGVGDFYGSQLGDQWVDVTGAAPGDYRLRAEVDPVALYEGPSTRGDNALTAQVTIPGTVVDKPAAVTTPAGTSVQVQLVGRIVGGAVKSRKNATCATYEESCMTTAVPGELHYAIDTKPAAAAGVASVTERGGRVTFTPAQGFAGTVSFTVKATDSRGLSGLAVPVTVNVKAGAPAPSVSISPTTASVETGATQAFTASVANGSGPVRWAVDGIAGGNSTVGTIDASGVYTAPTLVPSKGSVQVTATHIASGASSPPAGVSITPAPPVDPDVIIALTPTTATLETGATQSFVATVSGTSDPLAWSVDGIPGGNATVGTISQAGLYTAPAVAPTGAVTVSATHPGSGARADAFVTVKTPAPPVDPPGNGGGGTPTDPTPTPPAVPVPPRAPASPTPVTPPATPAPPNGSVQGRPVKADAELRPDFRLVPRGKRTYLRVSGTVSPDAAGRKVAIQRVDGAKATTMSRAKVTATGGISAMVRVRNPRGLTVRAVIGSTPRTKAAATQATTVRLQKKKVALAPRFSLVSRKGSMYLRVTGKASRAVEGRRVVIQRIGEKGNRTIGVIEVKRAGRLSAMVKLPPFDGLAVRAVIPATRTTARATSTTSAVHLPGGGA